MLQAAQQIDSMINEIQVFANNMIIDPSVQRALFGSSGKQMSQGEAFYLAVEQLKNFKALRDDIHSIALVTKDNQIVWETKLSDGDYFKELMRQEWYQEIGKTSHAQFSTIHEVADANGHRSKTLSYIVPVYNMQQYQKACLLYTSIDEAKEQVRRETGLSGTDAQVERVLAGQSCSMDENARTIIQKQGRIYTEALLSAAIDVYKRQVEGKGRFSFC